MIIVFVLAIIGLINPQAVAMPSRGRSSAIFFSATFVLFFVSLVTSYSLHNDKSSYTPVSSDLLDGYTDESLETIEFMLTGDLGFKDGGINEASLKDCVFKYNITLYGAKMEFTYDFNKAKWRSSAFEGDKFKVSCSGECTTFASNSNRSIVDMFKMTLSPKDIVFPVLPTRDRFNVALGDFQEQCKGKTSKY
jgi:hypothetical protein